MFFILTFLTPVHPKFQIVGDVVGHFLLSNIQRVEKTLLRKRYHCIIKSELIRSTMGLPARRMAGKIWRPGKKSERHIFHHDVAFP